MLFPAVVQTVDKAAKRASLLGEGICEKISGSPACKERVSGISRSDHILLKHAEHRSGQHVHRDSAKGGQAGTEALRRTGNGESIRSRSLQGTSSSQRWEIRVRVDGVGGSGRGGRGRGRGGAA